MEKEFFRECIRCEVYGNRNLNFVEKALCKYFQSSTNCVYLIRKMMYLYDCGKINRLRSLVIRKQLINKYAVHIYPTALIGKGLNIPHPCSIVINGRAVIGENFTIRQNCTIGVKDVEDEYGPAPKIGNNVNMGAHSILLGDIMVTDDVLIGANSLLISDAAVPGVYVGSPAKRLNK